MYCLCVHSVGECQQDTERNLHHQKYVIPSLAWEPGLLFIIIQLSKYVGRLDKCLSILFYVVLLILS